jgi:membrane-bound serine protease (ClpP class)
MWVVAGVLLGLVVLFSLLGFHMGPHAHLAAGVVGVVAAAWLVVMVVDGRSDPLLWVLVSADAVVSVGVGLLAWHSFSSSGTDAPAQHVVALESAEGVAVSDLDPNGTVRVHGEDWSATSVNGPVRAGTAVQVLRVKGVRLEVWGEEVRDDGGAGSVAEGTDRQALRSSPAGAGPGVPSTDERQVP